jgi:excisionase family DNA binding protein
LVPSTPLPPGERLISVAEIADRGCCSPPTIYDAIRNGKLSACRVGDLILIAKQQAQPFIPRQKRRGFVA